MSYFSSGLTYVLPFLIVITVLVFVHELGHYLVARWAGVRIEVFSIGFGPELFGRFDRHGTRWRVSAIPFGGYVKMFGDADPASMPSDAVPTMTAEERAVSFHHKSLRARAAILFAGPGANFLFALVVLTVMFSTLGEPYSLPVASMVLPDSAAAAGGMQPGDTFLSIDGSEVRRFEDVQERVLLNTGTPMRIVVRRGDAEIPLTITPKISDHVDPFGHHEKMALLGVQSSQKAVIQRDPATAVWRAGITIYRDIVDTLNGLGQMITGARTTEGLHGPLGMAQLSGEFAQSGVLSLISLMALLSINLGLVNLFPIPVLDGGHLLFYAAEAVLGHPLGRRTQEFGFRLGLALVLSLMVFATWNDLVQMHVFAFLKRLVT